MTNGFHVKDYGQPVKRYVQTMDLKDDPELIAEYRRRHSKEELWKEIRDGISEVGILDMQIFILGTRLVMTHSLANRSGKTIWPSSSNVPKEPQATRNGR